MEEHDLNPEEFDEKLIKTFAFAEVLAKIMSKQMVIFQLSDGSTVQGTFKKFDQRTGMVTIVSYIGKPIETVTSTTGQPEIKMEPVITHVHITDILVVGIPLNKKGN